MLHISPSKCFTKLFFLTPYKHPKELEATKTHILGGCCKKTLCRRHTPVISLAKQSNMAGPKSTESNKNLAHLEDSFISRSKLNQFTPNWSQIFPNKLYFSILYSKISYNTSSCRNLPKAVEFRRRFPSPDRNLLFRLRISFWS